MADMYVEKVLLSPGQNVSDAVSGDIETVVSGRRPNEFHVFVRRDGVEPQEASEKTTKPKRGGPVPNVTELSMEESIEKYGEPEPSRTKADDTPISDVVYSRAASALEDEGYVRLGDLPDDLSELDDIKGVGSSTIESLKAEGEW